jgi:integrase
MKEVRMARRSRGEGTIWYSDELSRWVGQLTLPDGRKRTKKGKTQTEVKKWLLEQRTSLQDGTYLPDTSYTVSRFLDRYFHDIAEHNLAPRTLLSYKNLRKHLDGPLGNLKLSELRAEHLQKLYADELNAGSSPGTVQTIHQFIHAVLNYAVKWGLMVRNVADSADAPRKDKATVTVLTSDQAKQILELAKEESLKMHTLILCAISLGMREGELLALDWSAVNWSQHTIRVERQLQYLPGKGLIIRAPKTKSSFRTLPLPEVTYQALKEIKEDNGLIFHTSVGTPYSPRNILRYFHRLLKKMDMAIMPFHNLRHSCASFHLALGTNPRVVADLLGHSSVGITLSTYSHLLPGVGEEAAKRMDTIFN